MYQLLDSGFIGLIFSCFSEDAQKVSPNKIIPWKSNSSIYVFTDLKSFQVGRIQVIAFQSLDGQQNQMTKPVSLTPVLKTPVIDLEASVGSSDNVIPLFGSSNMEHDTGDSESTPRASKACLN